MYRNDKSRRLPLQRYSREKEAEQGITAVFKSLSAGTIRHRYMTRIQVTPHPCHAPCSPATIPTEDRKIKTHNIKLQNHNPIVGKFGESLNPAILVLQCSAQYHTDAGQCSHETLQLREYMIPETPTWHSYCCQMDWPQKSLIF